MTRTQAVVLAAGKGTRFNSTVPKVLQPLAGRPVLGHVVQALHRAGIERTVLVIGFGGDQVCRAYPDLEWVEQREQLGTGHALLQARPMFDASSEVVVVNGDMPLLDPAVLSQLVARHHESSALMTALACDAGDVTGMGRILRDAAERPIGVVEHKVANAEQLKITEWNCGLYVFNGSWLWGTLGGLHPSPIGEVFLTDLFALAANERRLEIVTIHDPTVAAGVNDRVELAWAEQIVRERTRERHLRNGVLLISPVTTVIDIDVTIGAGTTIQPGCVITGKSAIGDRCSIGPLTYLSDCQVEDDAEIGPQSTVQGGRIGAKCEIRPHTYLMDCVVGAGAQIGPGFLDNDTVPAGVRVAPYTAPYPYRPNQSFR